MGVKNGLLLVLLAAIWGASFLFMRIGAPAFGPIWLIEFRIGFGALFLIIVGLILGKKLQFKTYWRHYMVFGVVSSALPFLCYGYSAQYLSASMMSIVNALTPVFGTVISALYFKTQLEKSKIIGLISGVVGVAVIVGFDTALLKTDAWFAVLVVMGAPLCYGIAATYTQVNKGPDSFANAQGSMMMGALVLMPLLVFSTPQSMPGTTPILAVLGLGILCTGVAYLIFFKLLGEIGASSTLTVTFLIPIFGIGWGVLLLDEVVGIQTLIGAILVIYGTIKTTGFKLRQAPTLLKTES